MARTRLRICTEPGCPEYTEHTRCDEHRRRADKARGTRQERGYDATYDAERRAWAPKVAAGEVDCWRCGERILPADEWNLGHDGHDRSIIRGPEHARRCNLSAAGKASHGISPDG